MNEPSASSRPKRWLLLTQYYPPEIGAPQIRLQAIAHELRRRKIAVEVLTALPNYPTGKIFARYRRRWWMRETLSGVPVQRTWVYATAGKSAAMRLVNYLSFTFTAFIAAFSRSRPDVLFVESQPLTLGMIAVLMKWFRRVPYIYNVPDLQVDVARELGFIRNPTVLRVAWGLENFFLRRSWRVSTVTRSFMTHIESRGVKRDRITFLPNGADTDFLRPRPPSLDLLRRWNLHGKKVFLYVGTCAFYHGLDNLVEAAGLLRERHDLVFLMIGHGPERERLRSRCAGDGLENVVFADSDYAERDQLYSIAYASLATFRKMDIARSMIPAKIFPSLSCGVPVIYAGEGEAAEILLSEACGMVVPPQNPVLLAQAVIRLAESRERRDLMGKAGRRLVQREYSWADIVERWLSQIDAPAVSTTIQDDQKPRLTIRA